MKLAIDCATLRNALAVLAPMTAKVVSYHSCPWNAVAMEADATGLRLSTNNGDVAVSTVVPADVEAPGTIAMDAHGLLKLAKAIGAGVVHFEADGEGVVKLRSARANYSLASIDPETLPVMTLGGGELVDLADAGPLACSVEGFDVAPAAVKLLAKLMKPAKGQDAPPVEIETYHGTDVRMSCRVGAWSILARCAVPEFAYKPARSPKFQHRTDSGYMAALDYLRDLAIARGFQTGQKIRIETRKGMILGATFGGRIEEERTAGRTYYRDRTAEEIAERRAEWEAGGNCAITDDAFFAGTVSLVADADRPAQYAGGAYSVPMPRENAAMAAAVCFSQQNDDGTWTDWRSVATDSAGKLDWDSLPAMADLFALPDLSPAATASEPVEARVEHEATIARTTAESLPAAVSVETAGIPVPDASADLAAIVTALMERVAVLESQAVERAALITAATTGIVAVEHGGAVAQPRAVRERIVRRYLAMRRERAALRDVVRLANAQYDTGMAQFEALKADKRAVEADYDLVMTERNEARASVRQLDSMLCGATGRAARLARIAVRQRKVAVRAGDDLRGARAEARTLARRLDDMRAPRGSPFVPAGTVHRMMAAAS